MGVYVARMDEATLADLRAFVVAVGCGSFSAAARELGTTQPTVSRTVARLEARLAVPLLVRSTRGLVPTAAGAVLEREARRVLDQAAAAVELTRRAHRAPGRLVVAVKPDGDAGALEQVLPAMESSGHRVDLLLRETHLLPAAVRTGEADACLVAGPVALDGLEHDVLLAEQRYAVLPADHPLAARDVLAPADLAAEVVARWPHLPAGLDHFYRGAAADEPAPAHGADVEGLAEALRMVELGRVVTFLPASVVARFARPGIRAVPVEGLAPSTLVVAWRIGSADPVLAGFVRACAEWAESRAAV
jgi:DNA-binding transcriptional LysR family regulator